MAWSFLALFAVASHGVAGASMPECAPVAAAAKQEVEKQLGLAANAAYTALQSLCNQKNATQCDESSKCTSCTQTATRCWVKGDLDNPCMKGFTDAMAVAASGAAAAGSKAQEILGKCSESKSEVACTGGIGYVCEWCNTTSSCHIIGAVKNNKCLQDHLKAQAVEAGKKTAKAAMDAAGAEANSRVNSERTLCGGMDGNSSSCSEWVRCQWCGDDNKCYWVGDRSNACVQKRITQTVDTANGVMKHIKEWGAAAGGKWNDMKAWGNDVCGKHVAKAGCDDAMECNWCATDKLCYVVASVNSPCGGFQATKHDAVDKWNSWTGKAEACSSAQKVMKETLNKGKEKAQENLNSACKTFLESEFYAQRAYAAYNDTTNNTQEEQLMRDMTSLTIAQTQQALTDAKGAANETQEQELAMAEWAKDNVKCNASGSASDATRVSAASPVQAICAALVAGLVAQQ